ncbi:uncharacterized protein N7483_004041 [Penicillium malachiteum]|uniref:uncharacterized protein n=1 Tax=Penicillium malachiteum TaxID=1324776 RepID=UPI0025490C29|nr:uncharacterized protein N7483_004041 [Penicillium malachiteum]KAJ5729533.1 hypothetical protein N7483_004041 [Penicillium malachiteum]
MLCSYLFVLATAWQTVVANSDSCSSSATIADQSDADALAGCDTIDGSITISSAGSGSIILYNITEVKGSFTADGISDLTTLAAPDLETINGGLTIENLDSLTNLSMNSLTTVSSDITVTGNKDLTKLEFLDLKEVKGQLTLTGSFHSISLPSLNQVSGQTTIRGKSMSCKALNSLKSEDVYRGGYSCSGGGSSLSAGDKAGIGIGVIIGVIVVLVIVWLVWRRRRRQRRNAQTSASVPPMVEKQMPVQPEYQAVPSYEPAKVLPSKPLGPSPALLDSRSIHEAAYPASPVREYYELDGGPVHGTHQRPLNSE